MVWNQKPSNPLLNNLKVLGLVLMDALLIPFSLWAAISLSLGHVFTMSSSSGLMFAALTLFSIPFFYRTGIYHAVLRYAGAKVLNQLVISSGYSAVVLLILTLLSPAVGLHWSLFLVYGVILFFTMFSCRVLLRFMLSSPLELRQVNKVAIYGAGSSGRQLAEMLRAGEDYKPVMFLDDDVLLHGRDVAGLRVYSPRHKGLSALVKHKGVTEVLLSLPSATRSERREILKRLEYLPVPVKTVPCIRDIVSGKAALDQLQEVSVDDLLGRDSVETDRSLVGKCITGKTVLVTGAGGSIGSELCRQVIKLRPKVLILLERSEYALYQIDAELIDMNRHSGLGVEVVNLLGSVTNKRRLEQVFSAFSVDTVYHAAAYKHVPLVEHNAIEGLWNNTFGTWYAADVARKTGVSHFVLISTDKAVRPTNVMGGSKRLAEMVLQAYDKLPGKTIFSMVRFGNVLGSSGSVVPLFRRQIMEGGPVTVTHPEIIRYFMTISEAVALVIQAGAMAKGGDVFVLDMGEPVKILDLARQMIHLSGLEIQDDENPNGDIRIEFSGLRPGEKLYEELLIGNDPIGTHHPKIMRAEEEMMDWLMLERLLGEIKIAVEDYNLIKVRQLMLKGARGYAPTGGIEDLVWNKIPMSKEKVVQELVH